MVDVRITLSALWIALMLNNLLGSVIDRRCLSERTTEAHRYVAKGYKKGNVVITLVHHNKT